MRTVDIAVIGSGPGGQRAAIQAAKLGASVIVIEERPTVGGTITHAGTVPSKAFREAVLYLTGFRQRSLYGNGYVVKRDLTMKDLTLRVEHVVREEVEVMEAQLARNSVPVVYGHARFVDPHRLSVTRADGYREEVTADKVILAVGTRPAHSDSIRVDGERIFDTECLLSMPEVPGRLIVVGAGIIGLEYASMFAALGSRVTLVDQRQDILEFLDAEAVDTLMYHLRDLGVVFRLGERVTAAGNGSGVTAFTESRKQIHGDALLYCVGRQGRTDDLGLDQAEIPVDHRGRIAVNQWYQTVMPHIYAVGDVIGPPALAASAWEQGRAAARHALGAPVHAMSPLVPCGIYTIPEVASVGSTERELTESKVPYETGIARYRETARGKILGDETGWLKLLVHAGTGDLLGVHIVGEGASELIHIGQAVMALGGGLSYLLENVFNYPTLAECYKTAALDAANKLDGWTLAT